MGWSEAEPTGIEAFIAGGERLLKVFGYWPSFHDAEVIDLHLWRGNVDPEKHLYQFPVLTLDLHLWELTDQLSPEGYLVMRHHTRATLTFRDVDELRMNGFNHQNAIMSLSIRRLEKTTGPSPYFSVEITPAFGFEASFTCLSVEVTNAIPCTSEGKPL